MDLLDRQIAGLPPVGEIVYAVLDWGLGHATRSSVVIKRLLDRGREVTIASDGHALAYLQRAFPTCKVLHLPAYDVTYTRSATMLPLHLALQAPKILRAINAEHRLLAEYVQEREVAAIISDNRYGCYSSEVQSIVLTHQMQIIVAGLSGWLANSILTRWLSRFDTVWVPDDPAVRLSGKLSHHPSITPLYVGVLSVMQTLPVAAEGDILIALSGPEPQRTLLEEALVQVVSTHRSVLLVRGTTARRTTDIPSSWRVIDLADAQQMSAAFAAASLVICRSGYSTIMDLHHLGKQGILIPTPGQPEQEYLGEWLVAATRDFVVVSQDELSEKLLGLLTKDGL